MCMLINKKKIFIPRKGPMQLLDNTILTSESEYSLNVSEEN